MNLKERLLTLYALSQRGVGGERENAEQILNRTLKSHNMTLEEFLTFNASYRKNHKRSRCGFRVILARRQELNGVSFNARRDNSR